MCLVWVPGLWYLGTPSWRLCQSTNFPKQQESKVLGSFTLVLVLPPKMLKNSGFERRIRVLKSWLVWELDSVESFRCKTDGIPGKHVRKGWNSPGNLATQVGCQSGGKTSYQGRRLTLDRALAVCCLSCKNFLFSLAEFSGKDEFYRTSIGLA